MKQFARGFVLAVALTLIISLFVGEKAYALTRIPTPSGNYCMDEVNEFFAARFPGEKIASIAKFGSGRTWAFWARTSLCTGHIVFDFSGMDPSNCINPQYISRTLFMNRVLAYGDCEQVMPHDEFPY